MPTDPRAKPRQLTSAIDLNRLDVAIKTPEKAADRNARLLREAADAALDRRKEFVLFVFSLAVIGTVAVACLVALFVLPANSAWVAPLLTPLIGGLVGYQTGKSRKPTNGP